MAKTSRHLQQQSSSPDALNLHLHPKQWIAFETVATEVLYGGAAGGGKSHLMRIAAVVWCSAISGLQVYLFRRVRDDLIKNHMEGPKGFRALLASWVSSGLCQIVEDEIRFWNGSRVYLCHCKDEKDIYKYQGAEIHVLIIDELTHFTEVMYRFLRNRVRMVGIVLPAEYTGRFPRIVCGANPGNIGHLWVKTTFITAAPSLEIRKMSNSEGGMIRQFIPATLEDNPSMALDDPGYEGRLEGLGSATLVKAMRWGDWDVVEGAFFDCWEHHQHVIAPFAIPDHWLRFRSGDWGSYAPFSIGWWAVVSDDFRLGELGGAGTNEARSIAGLSDGGRSCTIPRGAIIRYREWYGKVGGKLTAEQVGIGIADRERSDPKLTYAVLDPAAFSEDGGPSIAERINDELMKAKLTGFTRADNSRVTRVVGDPSKSGPMGGWDQVRSRMIGSAQRLLNGSVDWSTGLPMIYFFATCVDSIRTIPVLQHDQNRAEDLDTNAEDHAADDVRYACMSRPWIKPKPEMTESNRDGYRESRDDERSAYSELTL